MVTQATKGMRDRLSFFLTILTKGSPLPLRGRGPTNRPLNFRAEFRQGRIGIVGAAVAWIAGTHHSC